MAEQGYEENDRRYEENAEFCRVFFRPYSHAAPYACCTWRRAVPDEQICEYLIGSEHRLNYSINLCDMLGLETLLLRNGGLLLHSSFIRWKGRGILFSAASGVGKSTQAELWVKHQGAEILNGDRAGLRRAEEGWMAYGLPYAGSSNVYRNESAPVAAIIMLEQAKENSLIKLNPIEAFRRIYPQLMIHTWDRSYVEASLALADELLASVPVYLLRCRPDEEAVMLVREMVSALPKKGCISNE